MSSAIYDVLSRLLGSNLSTAIEGQIVEGLLKLWILVVVEVMERHSMYN